MTTPGPATEGLPRRVVLAANTDWYLYNFRRSLADELRVRGAEVLLLSPPGPWAPRLVDDGFRWLPLKLSPGGLNPLAEGRSLLHMVRLYRELRPDLAHHFTIKCVLYGTMAAQRAGVPAVVNAVTGRGHLFTDSGARTAMLRPPIRALYRRCLSGGRVRVIFQNSSDREECIQERLVPAHRAHLIRGSGVDLERFSASRSPTGAEPVQVLFASRLLREKGILELLTAVDTVNRRGPVVHLSCAGEVYEDNPSSLARAEVEAFLQTGSVSFLGHVEDMPGLIDQSDIVVLPSYREGTPRILLEAAAMERPIVATDIAGCRGVVDDGLNGFLVPPRDIVALVRAIRTLASDPELRRRMGRKGRRLIIERGFDQESVVARTLDVYRSALTAAAEAGRRTVAGLPETG